MRLIHVTSAPTSSRPPARFFERRSHDQDAATDTTKAPAQTDHGHGHTTATDTTRTRPRPRPGPRPRTRAGPVGGDGKNGPKRRGREKPRRQHGPHQPMTLAPDSYDASPGQAATDGQSDEGYTLGPWRAWRWTDAPARATTSSDRCARQNRQAARPPGRQDTRPRARGHARAGGHRAGRGYRRARGRRG
jgi:hypothetical protein